MSKGFLQIDNGLFKMGLNPTEILILAKIMEYNRTTGKFFMSNKALGEMFGISESTISRTLDSLESKGFITRHTENVKGGKKREISVNLSVVSDAQASN